MVQYMGRGNEERQELARVKNVRKGRRGKVKVETDAGALVAGPGEAPRASLRGGRGQVTSLQPEHTGRINEVGRIMDSASRDELIGIAEDRGVDVGYRATSRDLAESVAATGGLPDDDQDGVPGRAKGRDGNNGRGPPETPPGIARLQLENEDPRPDASDEKGPGFLFF